MTPTLDLTSPLGITISLIPEIVLSICAMLVLLVVSWRHKTAADSRLAGWLSVLSLIVTGAALAWLAAQHKRGKMIDPKVWAGLYFAGAVHAPKPRASRRGAARPRR